MGLRARDYVKINLSEEVISKQFSEFINSANNKKREPKTHGILYQRSENEYYSLDKDDKILNIHLSLDKGTQFT